MKIIHGVLALAGLAAASGACAKEKNWTIDGASLAIVSPCAKSVSIEPSATLSGKIEVSATAERQSEIDQVQVGGGSAAAIAAKDGRCKTGWPHVTMGWFHFGLSTDPSLEISVRVPPGTAIDIREGNSTDYEIGEVGGPLRLDLSGSGDVEADEARDLVAHLSGSGRVHLERVSGTLEARLSGSGDIAIGHASVSGAEMTLSGSGDLAVDEGDVGAVSARLSGSGSLTLGDGKIGKLIIVSSGSGEVTIEASVADADLSASGSGDIGVREVTGPIKQSLRGSGTIKIGQ